MAEPPFSRRRNCSYFGFSDKLHCAISARNEPNAETKLPRPGDSAIICHVLRASHAQRTFQRFPSVTHFSLCVQYINTFGVRGLCVWGRVVFVANLLQVFQTFQVHICFIASPVNHQRHEWIFGICAVCAHHSHRSTFNDTIIIILQNIERTILLFYNNARAQYFHHHEIL